MTGMRIVTMGVHVLDVLVRPIEFIPEGQRGARVEDIRITAAGTAGGTALTLRKLGADVRTVGAIGSDAAGDMLLLLLGNVGIDTSMVVRRTDVQTSASVLPIRPNGDRPAFHVVGANGTFGPADVDWDRIDTATNVHVGGPELFAGGGPAAAEILAEAKRRGITTSVDVLSAGHLLGPTRDTLDEVWPHVDFLLPNDDQLRALGGTDDLDAAARVLIAKGAGCVAVTCGGDGAIVVTADDRVRVPAFAIDVRDTTGCGDAFSAGFLTAVAAGRSLADAATVGCAAASHVATGLGSDHGDFDMAALDAFVANAPRLD